MRNLTALLILFLLLSCEKDSDSPDTSFFSLEVSSSGGGSVSISAGNYPEGSNLSIQAVPLADYNFSSWSGSLSSTANPLEITLTQNLQLQANFVKKQFELNVSVTGEGSVDQKLLSSGKSYEVGSQVELSATPATGWEFEQWTGGIESTENPVTINLNEAKEVTAVFVRKQYNLNLTITGEGTVNEQIISQPAQYDFETQVRLTAVAANDWEFESWSGDISGTNNPIELSIDKEYQLSANFKLKDTDVPLVAAPTPTQDAADVISIFSDSYDNAVAGINYNPNWGQSTQTTIETVEGNEVLKYANLNYQGTDWATTPIDVSSKTTVHIDYWTADTSSFNFYIISPGPQEKAYNITPTAGEWGSVDIPLSHFDNVNLADLIQIKVGEGSGTLYLDNIYFYGDNGDGGGDGGGNNNLELIWSDEFNYEGRPDSSKWHHQTFAPNGGSWFNGELQHYVDKENTTYVTNGTLKIVARKETYTTQNSTKEYTSARLNSKFDFKYGRIDVRAKLPSGAGTWPAIWTLGSNINEAGNYFGDSRGSVGWPACGEIDIMEQNGWDKTRSYGYFHWANTQTGEYQNTGTTTYIADSSSEFHLYSLIWDETKMQILLDNVVFMELPNEASNPFDNPHYLLLNIAIGGNLGGEVPANFPNQVMEVDYVRIYQ